MAFGWDLLAEFFLLRRKVFAENGNCPQRTKKAV
jgi:hypothetical protein